MTLDGVVITPAGVAIEATAGATVDGAGVSVLSPDPDAPAQGLSIDAATVTLRRAVLDGFLTHRIDGAGAALGLEQSAVLRTRGDDLPLGGSVHGGSGATLTLTAVVFEENRDKAIRVDAAGTTLAIRQSVFRDTESRSDDRFGFGIGVANGANGTIESTLIERNRTFGAAVQHVGSSLALTDVVVRDQRAEASSGLFGRGLDAQGGARLELTRVQLLRNLGDGMLVATTSTQVVATDLLVAGTRGRDFDAIGGFGIWMLGGAFTGERIVLDDNRYSAAWLVSYGEAEDIFEPIPADRITFTLTDATIIRTRSNEADGFMGSGILAARNVTADLTRVRIEDNRAIGMWLIGEDVSAEARETTITGVGLADCVVTRAPTGPAASALRRSTARRCDSPTSTSATPSWSACRSTPTPAWTSRAALVTRNLIGVNVQGTDYDLSRLQDRVVYVDNGTNLDSATLAAPSTGSPDI